MGFGVLFVVGLLTSLHCVAMCGGINISQCVTAAGTAAGVRNKIAPSYYTISAAYFLHRDRRNYRRCRIGDKPFRLGARARCDTLGIFMIIMG
jgi:hypothetical protein